MSLLSSLGVQLATAGIVGFAGTFAVSNLTHPAGASSAPSPRADCVIKGNISIGTGERIYHMPGQHWYAETKISPEYGERWFCTEAEARAAGWRKAGD